MVKRIYVEKKKNLRHEAKKVLDDLKNVLGVKNLEDLRIINRYDVENISDEIFDRAVSTIFSEPQLDIIFDKLNRGENDRVFAVEYLPGQFDQRADSAAQCIELMAQIKRPDVRSAKIYVLSGQISDSEFKKIKKYIINPVEAREASLDEFKTLKQNYKIPEEVAILTGFNDLDDSGLEKFVEAKGLAMDFDDIKFCQDYFKSEKRDPTITEIRMIDTYWSDHCRHTTFLTTIDSVKFEDNILQNAWNEYISIRNELNRTKPINLMDVATVGARYLKAKGRLPKLDESEEINACTVKIKVNSDGEEEDYLLLFKNETHNHPTEIEPFGGAATCIGGAIRDPLSGRAYVYGAMRVTGASDPLTPVDKTIKGKLPQRKIVTTAADGYSSYGNQIGLATGQVSEIYHPGYAAKRMEIGAVIGAVPECNVRREEPQPGDVVILLGGRTGRDGIGGATGSSKAHNVNSVEECGAEVQKGNAPEERKLQRLFRNKEATRLIKRCNDFGAGGVSVSIGELADGLDIDLDKVPKKYEGLDGTEIAISESQERMSVVVAPEDAEKYIKLANRENLEATVVAKVKAEKRLTMTWNGKKIVDISRQFLNSNGAEKHIDVKPAKLESYEKKIPLGFAEGYKNLVSSLNCCSERGLSEEFDSTIGAGTVVMPFGGKYQLTPSQAMVQLVSVEKKHTDTVSFMAWGFDPYITEKNPYNGAYLAVVESVSKLIASGAKFEDVYLTFQEYFEKPGKDPERWGQPLSALLGALKAQMDFSIGAIGGKDSMSGSFENIDVPPTLVSFAVTTGKTDDVVTDEFKSAGHKIVLLSPETDLNGLPVPSSQISLWNEITSLISGGKAVSVYTPGHGGIADAIFKMCIGNKIGFEYDESVELGEMFSYNYGSFIVELTDDSDIGETLGYTCLEETIKYFDDELTLAELLSLYEGKLEPVYPCNIKQGKIKPKEITYKTETKISPKIKFASPKALIPVFPGTNCEYDSAKALSDAGIEPEIFVINNLSPEKITESVREFAQKINDSQIIFIPGGFSGGDEPDGSGKFITSFFRNGEVKDAVNNLLKNRDGLMLGVCNGFQALIKLGLVPYGEIRDETEDDPTLTFNTIGRHQSMIVRVRVSSNKSPWLCDIAPGEIFSVPISHGEGRFIAKEEMMSKLIANGQIAAQYVDVHGIASSEVAFNPNNSDYAVEGILSPDGRVFGKMGHVERYAPGLYKNVPGNYDMGIFRSAAEYFK